MPPENPASLLPGSPWQLKLSLTLSLQAIDLESFPEPGCPERGPWAQLDLDSAIYLLCYISQVPHPPNMVFSLV